MARLDLQETARIIEDVAKQEIFPRFGKLRSDEISFKEPGDPVTAADEGAEEQLTERLAASLPGSVVVGEEAYACDPSILGRLADDGPVFIIDPVDGTRHFAEGRPSFFTMVVLVKKSEILAGIVHHPLSGETLIAEKGAGVWLNG